MVWNCFFSSILNVPCFLPTVPHPPEISWGPRSHQPRCGWGVWLLGPCTKPYSPGPGTQGHCSCSDHPGDFLESSHFLQVSALLGGPTGASTPGGVCRSWSLPSIHEVANTGQDAADWPCFQDTLLAFVLLTASQEPRALCTDLLPSFSAPSP